MKFIVSWVLWLLIYINEHKQKKRCLTIFFTVSFVAVFDKNQRFFSLCSLMYINNYGTYDTKNFTVSFINTWCWCFRLFWFKNVNIKYYSKHTQSSLCRVIIYSIGCLSLLAIFWVARCVLWLILLFALLFSIIIGNFQVSRFVPSSPTDINLSCWHFEPSILLDCL